MRRRLIVLVALFIGLTCIAQNGINYKAVIKDDLGNPLANSSILIQFEIREDIDGLLAYSETHTATTDDNGIVILTIGTGTPITGVFGNFFSFQIPIGLNVQVDKGAGLVDMGTTAFNYVPYAFHALTAEEAQNITGIERIIENGATGWRLIGVNESNYGNIGFNAVDFSIQQTASNARGALGEYAFASGLSTVALGLGSSAFGFSNLAGGSYASAFGINNQATARASFAAGQANDASGSYAFVTGRENIVDGSYAASTGFQNSVTGDYALATGTNISVSGNGSFGIGDFNSISGNNSIVGGLNSRVFGNNAMAVGFEAIASGNRSLAFGTNTVASAFGSLVLGRYNVAGGNATSWLGQDPLFEIGIGTSNSNRTNAVTVLKNGNVGIGIANPQEPLHVSGVVRIGTETIEDTGSNQLSIDASLIPATNNAFRLGNNDSRWIGVWATDGTINTSDRREKKNIKNLDYGLNEILQMQPISFNWKDKNIPDTKLGLIAQDLQTLVPEVVKSYDWEKDEVSGALIKKELDRLGVYYSDLVPVLINAIKEQQKIIDNEKSINAKQNSQLEALLSRVQDLEANQSN